MNDPRLIELTADIVSAHISNNMIAAADVPVLIRSVHDALARTAEPLVETAPVREPAVSIRASIKPDHIVCLEDGTKHKMLKRYLRTRYDLSPAQYRAKWGLPPDYPMVAPDYAETRRGLALAIGLGRKPAAALPEAADAAPANAPRKRLGLSLGGGRQPASEEEKTEA